MAQVNLKLSARALDYLSDTATDAQSLSATVTSLLNTNALLNSNYYYFDSWKSSASKAVMRFEDGTTRSYLGQISPTYKTAYEEQGVAYVHTLQLNVPKGIRETIKGNLIYDYEADYDNLWIDFRQGLITDYRIEILGKLADTQYGNISSGFTGALQASPSGSVSGSLSGLYASAQKVLKRSVTEGDFQVSGDNQTGVQVSGTLQRLRNDFHDGSYLELRDSRAFGITDSLSLLSLHQQELWGGDDTFNVELANTATRTLRINSGAGNDSLTLKGGHGLLAADAGDGDDSIRLLDSAPLVFGGSGIDTVETAFSHSIDNLTDIENLTLYGSKKADATGNAQGNVLRGNSAANTLDGHAGADRMIGGLGNDIYIADQPGDQIEEAANGGIDTVHTALSWALSAYLENLVLQGSIDLAGTGNGLANRITGNTGNNTLDGAGGIDSLVGGAGNDTYIVDLLPKGQGSKSTLALEDKIMESANQGSDTLQLRGQFDLTAASTIRLAAPLENLDAGHTGCTRLNLSGNAGDNLIIGNEADNILTGGAGADRLFGGAGQDTFRFNSIREMSLGERQDVIQDFTRGEDLIELKALNGFSLIGEQAFSGLKQLRYETSGTDLLLLGNNSGNLQADFSIKLIGIGSLNNADLLLS